MLEQGCPFHGDNNWPKIGYFHGIWDILCYKNEIYLLGMYEIEVCANNYSFTDKN